MSSTTAVINGALRRLGGNRITSIDDGSTNANYALDIYPDLLTDTLRSHDWNFATKRAKLAQLVAVPVFEFENAFAVPSDWLRTTSLHDNDAGVSTFDYRFETVGTQQIIAASREDVWMRYIYKVEDPTYWVADFRMYMILALASDLAIPVASSQGLHDRFAVRARQKLAQAKAADAMDSFPERRPEGSWVTSRGGRRPRVFPLGST